jgi:peptidyl-prolyl cis-trans isomerase SurA
MEKLIFKTPLMKFLILLFTITSSISVTSQTLFTYGTNTVTTTEFLKAYNKNKTETTDKEKALREYVDLYTKFKLKVKAAKDMQLDALPQLKNDLDNFKNQVAESYMSNESATNQLIDEAATNAQKDMHVLHFYIATAPGLSKKDSTLAANAIQEVFTQLTSGEKNYDKIITDIVTKYTTTAKQNDIGYITAFTLPYEYEKLIYALKPGAVSPPYKTTKGWHVFKLLDERKNPGKWRAAQILLAVNPEKSNLQEQAALADSLYKLLQNGADFAELAKQFSNDKITYMAGGELQQFTTGRFEQNFEKQVFSLVKDGDYSKPFVTPYGYHIVKRLGVIPTADVTDAAFKYEIKQRVQQDARMNRAKDMFNEQVYKLINYKRTGIVKDADLFKWADSARANSQMLNKLKTAVTNSVIYNFSKSNLTVKDWLGFIRDYNLNPAINRGESNKQLLQNFVNLKAQEYYRNNLEQYNADYKSQIEEFKEGNLLFEVMERKVWSSAAADSVGLKKYYTANKQNYKWAPSANVIVFNCGSKKAADDAYVALQQGKSWKAIAAESNGLTQADSGRYEMTQIILPENTKPMAGIILPVIVNDADGTASFLKILGTYAGGEQRSFEEARGLVINDYQTVLEEKWIAELKKKYPVKISEAAFKQLLQ